MKLPERLVAARERKGLTQVQLAKKLEVSKGTVAGWETGAHGIRKKTMPKVARVLDLDIAELIA